VRRARFVRVAPETFREAEVEHLDDTVARQHHVGGLQVAMHDAILVRGLQRRRDLPADAQRFLGGQRPAAEPLFERLAIDELHRDVERAVVLVETVDRGDIGVAQRREQLRFALQARESVGVAGEPGRQRFDRDVAAELRVGRAVHFAHAAGAEQALDLVDAEVRAGR
jgi:hypothetical protein